MAIGSILVVDDEPDLRTVYELALVREGYEVDTAGTVAQAKELLENNTYQVVITDMRLPDGQGIELVRYVSEHSRAEKCLVVTAYGSAENAVEALKAGAFDYLTKPVNLKQLRQIVTELLSDGSGAPITAPAKSIQPQGEKSNSAQKQLLGHSVVMQQVRNVIAKVAPTMAPVLVYGESGTGKELVARAIHQASLRAGGPFIAVNCGAIPENLMEAEFFGYRKGAFTGANEDRVGLFAAATGGTLFLDEIGELPMPMQAKLLRVIQERAVRAIGSNIEEVLDVRIISATHRKLAQDVKDGRFRQDLYYRLNVIEAVVPPLRERKEDIEEIANSILLRICHESGLPLLPRFEPAALQALNSYNFPGNVRELENILQRAVAMCSGDVICTEDLSLQDREQGGSASEQLHSDHGEDASLVNTVQPTMHLPKQEETAACMGAQPLKDDLPADLSKHMDNIERQILVQALEKNRFNRTAAATELGLSLRQIRYRIERLDIDVPEDKGCD